MKKFLRYVAITWLEENPTFVDSMENKHYVVFSFMLLTGVVFVATLFVPFLF